MRVVTLNVNGIRSAASKGMFDWLRGQDADVICLQEVRAQREHVDDPGFHLPGYSAHFHLAERKGYSGVAIYTRVPASRMQSGIGWPDFDSEGRWLEACFAGLSVVSLYLPSGSSGDERQAVKMDILSRLLPHLGKLRRQRREYLICGDINIAHRPIDLKNWQANQKHSGFLPEERAWLDELFDDVGFVDAFRVMNSEAEQYTWWSNRGQAWAKNVGWRIDYQLASPGVGSKVRAARIYKEQRFSDHAPLIMDYEYPLATR